MLVRPATPVAFTAAPYLGVFATSTNLSVVLSQIQNQLAPYHSAQYNFSEVTTTFLGYPATQFSIGQANMEVQTIIFQANGFVFNVVTSKVLNPTDPTDQASDDTIDSIMVSMKIASSP